MINNPWRGLVRGEARRVDSSGQYDFFWVVLEDGTLGIMLSLERLPSPYPKLPRLKNLELAFRSIQNGHAFVLALKDRSQAEIFETLCQDAIGASESAEDSKEALARFLLRTRRWHYLLRSGRTMSLSVEEQRGLVGELAFLKELSSSLGAESAIDTWKGPYGAAKDFEFMGVAVEVKARRTGSKPLIGISSHDQLSDVPLSKLFLRITNIESEIVPEGQDLHGYVQEIEQLFEDWPNAFAAWEQAILATGYDPNDDYDDRRWRLCGSTDYEVVEGFPRISSPVPFGIDNVKYTIDLDACAPFELRGDLIDFIILRANS